MSHPGVQRSGPEDVISGDTLTPQFPGTCLRWYLRAASPREHSQPLPHQVPLEPSGLGLQLLGLSRGPGYLMDEETLSPPGPKCPLLVDCQNRFLKIELCPLNTNCSSHRKGSQHLLSTCYVPDVTRQCPPPGTFKQPPGKVRSR